MVVAVVSYALREIRRARQVLEAENERSEALLTYPVGDDRRTPERPVAQHHCRQVRRSLHPVADIAAHQRASDTSPGDLVRFLDRLYTDLDALVDRHGLEKIKTSGDSYMVVSGVRSHARSHQALACLH